jgi:hypothetical protein
MIGRVKPLEQKKSCCEWRKMRGRSMDNVNKEHIIIVQKELRTIEVILSFDHGEN